MKIYLVGGFVRDTLLGLQPKDQDFVVVGGTPEYLKKQGYQQVGADFPVFLHPETKDEYALARKERKVGAGYHGFEVDFDPSVTLEEDLMRRDLTINSMAMDEDGHIIDPFLGKKDIENKILRHTSNHFSEDPLRVLRIARFLARYHHLGFSIANETKELMEDIVKNGELSSLNPERIKLETDKALLEKDPAQYFLALRDCGALQALFPEIEALFGVPQPPKYHPEIDTGVHTILTLMEAKKLSERHPDNKDKLVLLWSALLHDLGKAITPKEELPKHLFHEKNGVPIIEEMGERIRLTKREKEVAKKTSLLHLNVHQSLSMKPRKIYDMFMKADAFRKKNAFLILLDACEADAKGRTGFENKAYPQKEFLTYTINNLDSKETYSISEAVLYDKTIPQEEKGLEIKRRLRNHFIKDIKNIQMLFNRKEDVLDVVQNFKEGDIDRKGIKVLMNWVRSHNTKEYLESYLEPQQFQQLLDYSEDYYQVSYYSLSQEELESFKEDRDIGKYIQSRREEKLDKFIKEIQSNKKNRHTIK